MLVEIYFFNIYYTCRIFALSNYTGPASSFPKSNPESFCVHISFVAHNLSEVINEEVLRDLFSTVGEVLDVAIRRYYRQRHRQYGYAFVEFSSKEAALAAANMWKEKDHRGILIKCTIGHRVSGENGNRSREKDSSHSLLKHKNNAVGGVSGSHHGAAATPNPVRTLQHPPSQVGHPVQMANHSQNPFSAGNVPNSTTIAPSAGSHYPSQPSVQSTIENVPSSGNFVSNNNQHAIINNSSGNYLPRETQNAHAVHSFSNNPSATYVLNPTSSPTTLLPVSNSGSYVPVVYGYPQHIPQQHSLPHQTVFVANPSPYVLHANNHPLLAHPSPASTVANTVMSTFQPAQVQYVMVPPNQQPFPNGQLQLESKQQQDASQYPAHSMYSRG